MTTMHSAALCMRVGVRMQALLSSRGRFSTTRLSRAAQLGPRRETTWNMQARLRLCLWKETGNPSSHRTFLSHETFFRRRPFPLPTDPDPLPRQYPCSRAASVDVGTYVYLEIPSFGMHVRK